MKGAFPPPGARSEREARPEGGHPFSREGAAGRAAPLPRAKAPEVLEVKVPPVEPFTRPVLRDFAQDVMDAHLAPVDADEMA